MKIIKRRRGEGEIIRGRRKVIKEGHVTYQERENLSEEGGKLVRGGQILRSNPRACIKLNILVFYIGLLIAFSSYGFCNAIRTIEEMGFQTGFLAGSLI